MSSDIPRTHSTILSSVDERFSRALDAGDLFFYPSSTHVHDEAGIEFQIRLCPALQKKPSSPTPQFTAEASSTTDSNQKTVDDDHDGQANKEAVKSKPDPFSPPYVPNLHIGELRDEDEREEFAVLLNKFSVLPNHFLMVTREFKSQTEPLYPSELVQSYLFLDAAHKTGKNYFAFYNCGDVSGASQPHKHIQFIPVDDDGPPIEKLAKSVKLETEDKPFAINSIPFAVHVRRLPLYSSATPKSSLEEALGEAFLTLLDLMHSTIWHSPSHPSGQPSYNVILTRNHLYIAPRSREKHVLEKTGDELSVNALGFAGMLLVKSEAELEAVKEEGVIKILKGVGVDSVHEKQIQEPHETDDVLN